MAKQFTDIREVTPYCFIYLQKFMFFVLKSSDVLDVLVPILYFLNDARADQCKYILGLQVPHPFFFFFLNKIYVRINCLLEPKTTSAK